MSRELVHERYVLSTGMSWKLVHESYVLFSYFNKLFTLTKGIFYWGILCIPITIVIFLLYIFYVIFSVYVLPGLAVEANQES